MDKPIPDVSPARPAALWNRPLKFSFRDLFKSLSAAAVKGASG